MKIQGKLEIKNLKIKRDLRNISTTHKVWSLSGSQFKQKNLVNI